MIDSCSDCTITLTGQKFSHTQRLISALAACARDLKGYHFACHDL